MEKPMTHPKDCPFTQGDYLLLKEEFAELCRIRDKLMFMTSLAGTTATNGEQDTAVFIRRSMIGEAFLELGYHLGDLLDTIRQDLEAVRAGRGALDDNQD
jgi:hypothetical protein